MKKGRAVGAVAVLVLLAALVIPLLIASVILGSETPLTYLQRARVNRASHVILTLCLMLQIVAGWLLHSAFHTNKALPIRLLRIAALSAAVIICSFAGGFLISGIRESDWYRLVERLFL